MQAPQFAPPGRMAAPAHVEQLPPNQTLYVNNLSEKIKRTDLREALYSLFSAHGPVLEIVALKTNKLRGQAFVIYKDIQSASKALRELQNFPFFGRPMRINYARETSHLVEKLNGTFDEQRVREKAALKKAREATAADNDRKRKLEDGEAGAAEEEGDGEGGAAAETAGEGEESVRGSEKRQKTGAEGAPPRPQVAPPNNMLFVQNLPPETTELMVQMLFQQYPGYRSVRLVQDQGIAFVEFENIMQAEIAMTSLQGFKVKEDYLMVISFAK